jgi:hypothetical protein
VRTDSEGRVRLSIPLGPIETTWEVWLVGIPDGGLPATTSLSVPVSLPISARIDTGGAWTEGDRGDVIATLRNRSKQPVNVVVTAEPKANVVFERPASAVQNVTLPSGSARSVHFRVRATRPGAAAIAVTLRSPGMEGDALVHDWPVRPAGERIDLSNTVWVDSKSRLTVPLDQGVYPVGPPRLILERGFAGMLRSVLDSIDLDRVAGASPLADVVEIAGRMRRTFLLYGGDTHPSTRAADELLARASARLLALVGSATTGTAFEREKAVAWPWLSEADGRKLRGGKGDRCPKDDPGRPRERALLLDAAPASLEGSTLACWDAFLSTTMQRLRAESDPVDVGLAALALAERPYGRLELAALVTRLRELAAIRPSGEIALAQAYQEDRASRSIVLAALLRTAALVPGLVAPPVRVASWLAMQRDAKGGFGSTEATRYAVRALLPMAESETPAATVHVLEEGKDLHKAEVSLRVDATGQTLPLDSRATSVELQTDVPGIVARVETPMLRSWARPPDPSTSPLHVEAVWPETPRAGHNDVLRVRLRHDLGHNALIRVWIPLPPGMGMSEAVANMRQLHGTIAISAVVDESTGPTLLNVPIRCSLSGTFTAPEVVAYVEDDESIRAYAPARPIVVE